MKKKQRRRMRDGKYFIRTNPIEEAAVVRNYKTRKITFVRKNKYKC